MNADPRSDPPRSAVQATSTLRRRDQATIACLLLVAMLLLLGRLAWMAYRGGGLRRFDDLPQRAARMQLDLNAAGWPELSNLPGIGEILAREIVADRQAHGPFRSVDDLTRVRGIGPHRLQEIREFLTVGE